MNLESRNFFGKLLLKLVIYFLLPITTVLKVTVLRKCLRAQQPPSPPPPPDKKQTNEWYICGNAAGSFQVSFVSWEHLISQKCQSPPGMPYTNAQIQPVQKTVNSSVHTWYNFPFTSYYFPHSPLQKFFLIYVREPSPCQRWLKRFHIVP